MVIGTYAGNSQNTAELVQLEAKKFQHFFRFHMAPSSVDLLGPNNKKAYSPVQHVGGLMEVQKR